MNQYDFIFAGGGLAGLSLAYHLTHSSLRDRSILIVDRDSKTRNDRTWCFWTTEPTPFDAIVQREWSQIHFVGDGFEKQIALGDYRYKMIRGLDFYQHVRQELSARANIKFLQGRVEQIEDTAEGARVTVNGETYAATWVFDSRFDIKSFSAKSLTAASLCRTGRHDGTSLARCLHRIMDVPSDAAVNICETTLKTFDPDPTRCHFLTQHFKGWEIETSDDAFNPAVATLLDFRTPQNNAVRFFYVLPFSPRRALIEYVTTSPDDYDAALTTYIADVLKIQTYRILGTEGGVNPMGDYAFPRRAGAHIMNIGTRGGRIKPSTGYAFLRIQQDSAAIAQSLLTRGHPFNVSPDSRRYQLYDTLMLQVMQAHADQIKPIFSALFKNNPITRVLRFLDEEGSLAENALLIASLPPKLFLQALFRHTFLSANRANLLVIARGGLCDESDEVRPRNPQFARWRLLRTPALAGGAREKRSQ